MTTMAMEENKVQRNTFPNEESIKHYCRVCTANAKTKKRPEEYNVAIFKKIGLKSILEKFLQLELSEDDPLPKTICKKCFDKLMAVEFLQVVAKRSEQLFRDVLANRCQAVVTIDESYKSTSNIIPPPRKLDNKQEEVVVDVSMSDPLTKDIQKKLQVAQSKRDSICTAFSPEHLSRNAVTSSPITQTPVTIVHRMPKKRNRIQNVIDNNQAIQIPPHIPNPLPLAIHPNTTTVTLENPPRKKFPHLITNRTDTTAPLRHISEVPAIPQNVEIRPVISGNPQAMGHGMPLGSIIKDVDLLKLILKALKWPYNNQTLDIQIHRLKNTNFNDIIVDPNLLQDTDLIQILGPLLNPVPVTMQQQTYHITIPPESLDIPPTTMSYKLPAETSVQIITVPPNADTEKEQPHDRKERPSKRHMKHSVIRKKFDNYNSPPVIVVSDSDDERPVLNENEDIPSLEVQLDPAMYPGVEENSNSNEEMLATLNRQREAMMRMHRSKRKQSLTSAKNVEMVDDIMIVDEGYHMDDEPFPDAVLVKKKRALYDTSTSQSKNIKSIKKDCPSAAAAGSAAKAPLRTYECSRREKPVSSFRHGFIKIGKDSALPPLKKVKILSATPGNIQVNEPPKNAYTSKNTTLADADSTTKIVMKDSKAPKSVNTSLNFEGKFSEATNSVPVVQIPPVDIQNVSSAKGQIEETPIAVGQFEVKHAEGEKQKSTNSTAPRNTKYKKKNKYRFLGTFNISDDEMEPLHVEEVPPVVEKQVKSVMEVEAPSTITTKPVAEPPVVNETPLRISDKEQETETLLKNTEEKEELKNIELPSVDIKSEEQEEVDVKKEELDEESPPAKSNEGRKSQRTYVASKTAIKTELIKSTRSASKRKVVSKEEESSIEINSVTSDSLSRNQNQNQNKKRNQKHSRIMAHNCLVALLNELNCSRRTNSRPARRSKTLSKYYKGPPLSGTEGRNMRTRT